MRSKAKRRIAILLAAGFVLTLSCLTFIHLANRGNETRLEAERSAAMADYQAGNYVGALPHLQRYLEKARDGDKAASPGFLQALFACGKSRMNVRQGVADHLIAAKDIFLSYLTFRPGDLETEHLLLEIYPQIDYRREQLTLANSILTTHPDDVPALTARILALLAPPAAHYDEALKACDQLNASSPLDIRGQLLGMQIRSEMHVPAEQLVARADALRTSHPDDPRFELLLGATYLGARQSATDPAIPTTLPAAAMTKPDVVKAPSTHQAETRPADSRQAAWLKEGRHWLQTAADRTPPDADFVRQFVLTLDVHQLYPQSLQLLVKDAPLLHDPATNGMLVRRLWENGYYQEVADQTATLDPAQPAASSTLLALRASALFELASSHNKSAQSPPLTQPAAIVHALEGRSDDPVAAAWSILLSAQYISPARGPRELLRKCQDAFGHDPDNPVACLMAGEAYLGLGEKEFAASVWSRAASSAPEWAIPQARLADLRMQQGLMEEAWAHAQAAFARSPQLGGVRAVAACAWYALLKPVPREVDPAQWDLLLKEVASIQKSWPNEPKTLPLYVTLLCGTGQRDVAIQVVKAAASTVPPPTIQTLLSLDEVSRAQGLGLGDSLVARADGGALAVAVRKAMVCRNEGDAAGGLRLLQSAQTAAHGENDAKWCVAIASYLEQIGSPEALPAWIAVGDKNPDDIVVQSAATSSRCRYQDRAFWNRSIDRLRALTGDEGQLWRLEHCRWLLNGNDGADLAQKERSEAITMLSELVRQFPSAAEPHLLLAQALEQEKKPQRATDEYNAAGTLRPDDVEAALGLVRVLRASGKSAEAGAVLERASHRPGLSSGASLLLAAAFEQGGKPQQAIDLLAKGLPQAEASTDNDPVAAARDGLLARLYGRLGQFDSAQACCLRLLNSPVATTRDLVDATQVLVLMGNPDRAREFMTRLAERKLPPGVNQILSGRFSERFGTSSDALKSFIGATIDAPKSADAWRELASYHLRHEQFGEAAAAAARGLAAVPGEPALTAFDRLIPLVQAYRQPENLHSVIDALASDPAEPAIADLLNALTDLRAVHAGRDQQIARLRDVASRHRQFIPAQEQLIHAYEDARQFQTASDVAAAAMEADPYDPAPARLQVAIYCDSAQWTLALSAAQNWRSRCGSDTLAADIAISGILLHLDRAADAVAQLAPHVPAVPQSPVIGWVDAPTLPLRAAYAHALIADGKTPEASVVLHPLLTEKNVGLQARAIWMALAGTHKTAEAAGDWLDQIAAVIPADSIDEQLSFAGAWRQAGSKFGSVAVLQRARDLLAPMAARPAPDLRVWALFAEVAQELGDYTTAEQGWRRLLQQNSANASVPVRPEVRNNLAYLLLIRGDKAALPEARQLAEKAIAADPENSTFYDTLARVHAQTGERDTAVKLFRTALEKDPNNVEPMIGLADLLNHGSKTEQVEARTLLTRINQQMEKGQSITGPLKEQLKTIRESGIGEP